MKKEEGILYLSALKKVSYYYEPEDIIKIKPGYKWMNQNTIGITIVKAKVKDNNEDVYEVNIRCIFRDNYGKIGHREVVKQYHWYNNKLYRRYKIINRMPIEVKESLKMINAI